MPVNPKTLKPGMVLMVDKPGLRVLRIYVRSVDPESKTFMAECFGRLPFDLLEEFEHYFSED